MFLGIERRRGHMYIFQDLLLITQFVIASSKLEEHYLTALNLKEISLFTHVIGMWRKFCDIFFFFFLSFFFFLLFLSSFSFFFFFFSFFLFIIFFFLGVEKENLVPGDYRMNKTPGLFVSFFLSFFFLLFFYLLR